MPKKVILLSDETVEAIDKSQSKIGKFRDAFHSIHNIKVNSMIEVLALIRKRLLELGEIYVLFDVRSQWDVFIDWSCELVGDSDGFTGFYISEYQSSYTIRFNPAKEKNSRQIT